MSSTAASPAPGSDDPARSAFAPPLHPLFIVESATSTGQIAQAIVSSARSSEVFASLAQLSVPTFSDRCTVELSESDRTTVQLDVPVDGPPFAHDVTSVRIGIDAITQTYRYQGSITFGWREHQPTSAERTVAELLVAHCVALITQQGLADVVVNLERAVQSNRRIGAALGILMSTLKITEAEAFTMLRRRSQQQHRKVRELADDVVESGWLEGPAVPLTGGPDRVGAPASTSSS